MCVAMLCTGCLVALLAGCMVALLVVFFLSLLLSFLVMPGLCPCDSLSEGINVCE